MLNVLYLETGLESIFNYYQQNIVLLFIWNCNHHISRQGRDLHKKKNHVIFDSYLGLHFLTLYAGMSIVKMAIFEVCLSLVGHRYCICHMIEPQRAHVF